MHQALLPSFGNIPFWHICLHFVSVFLTGY